MALLPFLAKFTFSPVNKVEVKWFNKNKFIFGQYFRTAIIPFVESYYFADLQFLVLFYFDSFLSSICKSYAFFPPLCASRLIETKLHIKFL